VLWRFIHRTLYSLLHIYVPVHIICLTGNKLLSLMCNLPGNCLSCRSTWLRSRARPPTWRRNSSPSDGNTNILHHCVGFLMILSDPEPTVAVLPDPGPDPDPASVPEPGQNQNFWRSHKLFQNFDNCLVLGPTFWCHLLFSYKVPRYLLLGEFYYFH